MTSPRTLTRLLAVAALATGLLGTTPATAEPRPAGLATPTAQSSAALSSTAQPSAARPSTARSSATQSMAAQPSAAQSTATPQSTATKSTAAQPSAARPSAIQSTAAQPSAARPSTAQSSADGRHRPSGCHKPAPQPEGVSELRHVASGGLDRTYQLHLPDGYRRHQDWPLVLAFHGRGNTGIGTETFSNLSTLPAILVYPNGVIGTGDGDRQAWQGAPYAAPGVDDVRFTHDLLDELEATLCVDTRRVYATGKSNGAGFIGILACEAADRIAAIAPVAGAFYPTGQQCHPSRPVPVIDFHGTGDVTIPYAGDADRGLPAIPDWAAGWAARDRCLVRLPARHIDPDITITRWVGCARGTAVTHVAVTDGGHTWPGADSYSGGGYTTQTIEAHEVLWRFFTDHQLPRTHS